eukprot:346322_1
MMEDEEQKERHSLSGQALFEDNNLDEDLPIEQQKKVRQYLYLLLIQIMISLSLEMFFLIFSEDDIEWIIVGIAYFANSSKLYVVICCLMSMEKLQGDAAKILIFVIGPIISLYVIIYDIIWSKCQTQNDAANSKSIVNYKYIKHFNKYKVSIAVITAICGVLDGIITILFLYTLKETLSWKIIILFWALFCFMTGTWNLWKLRNHPTFTFKNIWQAPFKMCVAPKDDHDEYDSVPQQESPNDIE